MANWAVILGGSSGFGLATAHKLAEAGFHLFVVHRDRRSYANTLAEEWEACRSKGVQCVVHNMNALTPENIAVLVNDLLAVAGKGSVHVLLHSIAQGNVKPLKGGSEERLSTDDIQQTIHAMGISWQEWIQALLDADLFTVDARALALTSEGSRLAGENYAAVGVAKGVLETLCKYMAKEYGPLGLRTNLINAGVADTRALRGIPGHEAYLAAAERRNPLGRLTTPEDVANVVYLLAQPEAAWINGTIIRVDGGEQIVGW